MHKKFLFFLGCLMTSFSTIQAGQWYVKGAGGVNFIEKETVEINSSGYRVEVAINPGYYVAGFLGYRLSKFFRLETEGAYRNNIFNKFIFNEEFELPFNSPIHTWGAMGNAFMDFPCAEILFPYLGGGIGAQWVRSRGTCLAQDIESNEIHQFEYQIRHNGFAYQGIVGIGVELGIKGGLTIDYRYLNGVDTKANHTLAMSFIHHF